MEPVTPTPALRVNAEILRKHFKQQVSIIGKVEAVQDSKILILSSDNQTVTLNIANAECVDKGAISSSLYLEAVGIATGPSQVTLSDKENHWIVPLGNDLDCAMVNAATVLMHHPQMRQYFLPARSVQ